MLTPMSATYPTHRESTVVLRDGSTLTIRPVRVEDAPELGRFFADLSLESRVFRFFAAVVNADSSVQRMVNVDYTSSYGLVALAGAKAQIVGHAMFVYWSIDRNNEGEGGSNPILDFFTKSRWSRTGKFIK